MEMERRRWPRYPFIAAVEVRELQSGTSLNARTSDIGANGCYVDTINPLPKGATISIQITHQGKVLVAKGTVAHLQPNMGMGIIFIAFESGCAALLETWLDELAGGPTDAPDPQNRRRSQRVVLQVEVLLKTETLEGESVQIQASTLVVNAHGGLLEASLKLARNQSIKLISTQSGKAVGCRVVRVENGSKGSYTIAFEFDEANPQFWPITFPPEDWTMHEERITNDR